jgi:hypothetical protein
MNAGYARGPQSMTYMYQGCARAPLPSGEEFGHEAIENSQWPENDSSLNGDVSRGDNFGSLILMKPKPVAS